MRWEPERGLRSQKETPRQGSKWGRWESETGKERQSLQGALASLLPLWVMEVKPTGEL